MRRYARLVILVAAAMLAQWWWSSHGMLGGVAPQLLLVLTIIVAARHGAIKAMVIGFFWGLFIDLMSARLVGANALALTLVAYGTGLARRQVDLLGIEPQCAIVFALTPLYFLFWGLLGLLFSGSFLWVGWRSFLFDPFYNCLVAALAFLLWDPWVEGKPR
ncbi:MAG: rod shape-determining protein MreD [Elusimicrobia bacterium]|nr:rod shape-determining protein MreD [Elusimicrobiota bacterium]MDE2236884.1 rod shape-determining protein MreD [Elusimicrobiota bacterium]MDE2425341.1 rod shape-determining protein MreD [Elusimicrobiota bacterium]